MREIEKFELVRGSGNVYRNFDVASADVHKAKAKLAARIIGVLDDEGLSVRKAAKGTGFAAADFSRIRNAQLGRFTIDRMIRILAALDADSEVYINVRPRVRSDHEQTTPVAQ